MKQGRKKCKSTNKGKNRWIGICMTAAAFILLAGFLSFVILSDRSVRDITPDDQGSAYGNESSKIFAAGKDVKKESRMHIIEVDGLSQVNIPTGCELVSAVMALRYQKVYISPEDFIDRYLKCEDFYNKNGFIYGADPHKAFAGDPYGSGLGCFSEVIVSALNAAKKAGVSGMEGLTIKNVSGYALTDLEEYIQKNIPVICWVTMDMREPEQGMQYRLYDGSIYTWKAGEHCMLLVGFDEKNLYFRDPLKGGSLVSHERSLVRLRYEQMGKQAVVICREY